jgi:hypothetical protein
VGINDCSDRNFMIKNDIVYSIDEETINTENSFYDKLKKNRCLLIQKFIN